jgi:hypothetical protein
MEQASNFDCCCSKKYAVASNDENPAEADEFEKSLIANGVSEISGLLSLHPI